MNDIPISNSRPTCCYDTINASCQGHLNCLKYLHENDAQWGVWTCAYAALHGHLDCLMYAHENGCSWDENTCRSAVLFDNIHCLKYARENGCPWNEMTCKISALYNRIICFGYALENKCPGYKKYIEVYNSYMLGVIDEIVHITSLDFIKYPLKDLMLI